ncbi:tetratricopeptide repeat protein [Allokutzneria oryzae]|uniref:Tetratricopeptide repeat protein n=1 Tax=Allokutzneria oryzae TaxID=1378989 RepID=A0ABV5ZYC9_9PSEU
MAEDPVTLALTESAALCQSGKAAKAIRLLRPVVAANPADVDAWCALAAAYLSDDQPKKALEAAQRAAVLGSAKEGPHRLASCALTQLGRSAEAVVAADCAVRADPFEWRCHIALAEALIGSGAVERVQRSEDDADAKRALLAAHRASELAPTEYRPFEVLGEIAALARRWDVAEQAYLTALQLNPANDHAREELARVRSGSTSASQPTPEPTVPDAEPVLWDLLWRLVVLQGVGCLALVIGGLPQPSSGYAVFGVVLLAVIAAVLWRFVSKVPVVVRPGLVRLVQSRWLLMLAGGLFGLGTLLVVVWTLLLALWPGVLQTAVVACVVTALSGVVVMAGRRLARWRTRRTS